MATYATNTTTKFDSSVIVADIGTAPYTVPASKFFVGTIYLKSNTAATVSVGAALVANGSNGVTNFGLPVPINTGPGAVISCSLAASASLVGILMANSP